MYYRDVSGLRFRGLQAPIVGLAPQLGFGVHLGFFSLWG